MPEEQTIVSAIPELETEVPPTQFMGDDTFIILAWALVLLVALAAVGFILWLRRHRRKLPAPPTPLQVALEHLQRVEKALPPLKECSLQVSLIVREYLQQRAQDPALFETHEEFSKRLDSLSSVPEECRYDTRYLLEKLADMKYAGHHEQDPVQVRTIIEQARALLRRIHEAQQAPTNNA